MELVGAAVIGAAALGAAATSSEDQGGGALAGLAVTSALFATRSLSYCVRAMSQLEQQLNNLDRVVSLARVPPEQNLPDAAHPGSGLQATDGVRVELKAIRLEYQGPEGPTLALDGLDLQVRGGSHVGICGRSGSGKSSLAKVLAHLHRPTRGVVEVGGVLAATMPLEMLRTGVVVVPQRPQLLGRTIREVLDPNGSRSGGDDKALWSVLEAVGVAAVARAASGMLDAVAGRWSSGEQQLLVLARAVLRQPAVLVLDESTSQLDEQAAARIRALLSSELRSTTVLVIAHRLADVCACDIAVVMAGGSIVEVGKPAELLESNGEGSALRALADHLGAKSRDDLVRIAAVASGGGMLTTSL